MGKEDIIAAFKALDTAGDGYLTEAELRRYMTTMGEKMSDKEVDEMVKDAGGKSKIDYVKFVEAFTKAAADNVGGDDE